MKLQINCFDAKGKEFTTDFEISGRQINVNERQHARTVRVLLNHLRQATSSTKTRGEVNFANRKPWKQKGTGRARVSSLRSPLWRKGGIIFGPKPGCARLAVNKQERQAVLGQVIKDKILAKNFFGIEFPKEDGLNLTNSAGKYLKTLKMQDEKLLFLLSPGDTETLRKIKNLSNVEISFFDQLNVLDLSKKNKVVFLQKDKELMSEVFKQWM